MCVSSDKGGEGVREVAPPDTRTLEGIIPADYHQLQVQFQYDKSSDNNIFYSKKVQEIKKNGYSAATKVLCLYLHLLPLLAVIAHYLVT